MLSALKLEGFKIKIDALRQKEAQIQHKNFYKPCFPIDTIHRLLYHERIKANALFSII